MSYAEFLHRPTGDASMQGMTHHKCIVITSALWSKTKAFAIDGVYESNTKAFAIDGVYEWGALLSSNLKEALYKST